MSTTTDAKRLTAVYDAAYSYWTHLDGGGACMRDSVCTFLESVCAALRPHATPSEVRQALETLDTY
jgi:hypothetical protein